MSVKGMTIKNRTYYFSDDTIYTENFNPSSINIDEKSYKNILVYYIGYEMIKKDPNIYSISRLYLKVNGYFEEMNRNKFLTLVLTNKRKEKIQEIKKNQRFN